MQSKPITNFGVETRAQEEPANLRRLRLIEEKSRLQELKREAPLYFEELSKELTGFSEVQVIAEKTDLLESQVAGILALGLLGFVVVVTIIGLLDTSRWQIVKEVLFFLVPLLGVVSGYYFGSLGRQRA